MTRYIEAEDERVLEPLLSKAFWIIDEGFLSKMHGAWFRKNVSFDRLFVAPAGEKSKEWQTLKEILETLCLKNWHAASPIVGVGGGSTLDLVALVCHLYKRGSSFISVPTTTLALADASIGGKCAINCLHLKNMIGAYQEPDEHYKIDSLLGSDLMADWIIDGMSEIYKHGLIADLSLCQGVANYLKKPDRVLLKDLLRRAPLIKIEVVNLDKKQKGIRHLLNLGHTTTHGFEAAAIEKGIPLSHGRALVMGLCLEASIMLGKSEALKIAHDLHSILPNLELLSNLWSKAINYMKHDKKGDGSTIILTQFGLPGQMLPLNGDLAVYNEEECWLKRVDCDRLQDCWRALYLSLS